MNRLKIEQAHDGVRLVTLDQVVLGRLGQDPGTGRWQYDYRAGWMQPRRTRSTAPSLAPSGDRAAAVWTGPGSHQASLPAPKGVGANKSSVTKVNRCMADGRGRFLELFAAIYGEAG